MSKYLAILGPEYKEEDFRRVGTEIINFINGSDGSVLVFREGIELIKLDDVTDIEVMSRNGLEKMIENKILEILSRNEE